MAKKAIGFKLKCERIKSVTNVFFKNAAFLVLLQAAIVSHVALADSTNPHVPPPAETASEATHSELRKLKDLAIAAINGGEYEKILPLLHSNIVVTAENSEVTRTRGGVEQFYKKLLTGPLRALANFKIEELKIDELSILYGDNTAIAFGSGKFDYKFVNGSEYQLPCRWTATLIRENGHWLLAAFHNSVNVADNPVLDFARRTAYWFGFGGLIVGVLLGALSCRVLLRRKG